MKKIVFKELNDGCENFYDVWAAQLKAHLPAIYDMMLREGWFSVPFSIACMYVPEGLLQQTRSWVFDLIGLWHEKPLLCLPPNLTYEDFRSFRYYRDCIWYIQKGSETERMVKSRPYPPIIRHGLPVLAGEQVQHSPYFTVWFYEDDEERVRSGGCGEGRSVWSVFSALSGHSVAAEAAIRKAFPIAAGFLVAAVTALVVSWAL